MISITLATVRHGVKSDFHCKCALAVIIIAIAIHCCGCEADWTVDVIDGGATPPGDCPPSLHVEDDDSISIAYVSRLEQQAVMWHRRKVSRPWTRRHTQHSNFTTPVNMMIDHHGRFHACVVAELSTVYYLHGSTDKIESEKIEDGVRFTCGIALSSDGVIHVFFNRGYQLRHASRHPDELTWAVEAIADGNVEGRTIDSAQAPHGLHVVYGKKDKIYYNHNSGGEWKEEYVSDGQEPSLSFDMSGNPHIVAFDGHDVLWFHKNHLGEWLTDRPFEGGFMQSVDHVGMALDPAGYPTMVVTVLATPWSIESFLVRRKSGAWKVSEVPWAAWTNVAFDAQGRVHAVFADAGGVKHAVQ